MQRARSMRFLTFLALAQIFFAPLLGISMVYNYRISQITGVLKENPYRHIFIALPFAQFREKYDAIHQDFIGSLGSYIYHHSDYYFRVDGAFSHIKEKSCAGITTFSGTELDDLLFTVGKKILNHGCLSMTFGGLFGIPTHRIYRLQHEDFGYSQVGLGLQLDGSYELDEKQDLVCGGRYIYFVPRNALDNECEKHRITIGNVGDLLFAYKNNLTEKHGVEAGYAFRARFGAKACPFVEDFTIKTNYIRSSFYAVYKYTFYIRNVANRIMFDIGYGFDHSPKIFGNKYIVMLWVSWNVSF